MSRARRGTVEASRMPAVMADYPSEDPQGEKWQAIRAEYRRVKIGPLIMEEVCRAVRPVVRRCAAVIFGHGEDRPDDVIDDVVQQFVTGPLIGDKQLKYIMSVSRGISDFRALMVSIARRTIPRMRTRTVIDNLLDRARPILRTDPFVVHRDGRNREAYSFEGAEARLPSEDELWQAARIAALIPKVGVGSSERAPLVYSDESLRQLLGAVASCLGCRFALRDLDAVLHHVLPCFVPSFLDSDDGVPEVHSHAWTAEEDVMVSQVAAQILDRLDGAQRGILRDKLAGAPDAEMAQARNMSRPTLAKRKQAVFGLLKAELEGLERRLQIATMDRLGYVLGTTR